VPDKLALLQVISSAVYNNSSLQVLLSRTEAMGNCMRYSLGGDFFNEATVDQFVRIMRVDGKVLEFRAPISVNDVLTGHEGYTVFHPDTVLEPLRPDDKLVPGEIYYLRSKLPAAQTNDGSPISMISTKSDSCTKSEDANDSSSEYVSEPGRSKVVSAVKNSEGAVRLKVVITKQQLAALLAAKDSTTKISALQNLMVQLPAAAVARDHSTCSAARNCGWRPALERIAEGCDV